MTERLVQSVPTGDLQSYFECGWAYIMPDFDNPDHSKIEWLSDKMPVYPPRSHKQPTENASERTDNRRQQPA
jgi:hypothetical protein